MKWLVALSLFPSVALAWLAELPLANRCVAAMAHGTQRGLAGDVLHGPAVDVQRELRALGGGTRPRASGSPLEVRSDGAFPFFLVSQSRLSELSNADLRWVLERWQTVQQAMEVMVNPSEERALLLGPVQVRASVIRRLFLGDADDAAWSTASTAIERTHSAAVRMTAAGLTAGIGCVAGACSLLVLKSMGVWDPLPYSNWLTAGFMGGFLATMHWSSRAMRLRDAYQTLVNRRGALSGPQSILGLERSALADSGRGPFQDVSDATRFREFGRELVDDLASAEPVSEWYYFAGIDRTQGLFASGESIDVWLRPVPRHPDRIEITAFVRAVSAIPRVEARP
jgi:hypothetical protein